MVKIYTNWDGAKDEHIIDMENYLFYLISKENGKEKINKKTGKETKSV